LIGIDFLDGACSDFLPEKIRKTRRRKTENNFRQKGSISLGGAFRQGKPLAEGQKSADIKHNLSLPTPLRQTREMARGGLPPEENADF
jgi:hypothetical protein